jgi:putative FmdB family regulatory protein
VKCGTFEAEHGVNESLSKCPKCGSNIKRLISASGVVFKGKGFHSTDYVKDGLHETRPMGTVPVPEKKPEKKSA